MTNSKLVFKSLNENEIGLIKCANKDSSADLRTEGVGTIDLILKNNTLFELKDVIYSDALSANLLSLRKFVDQGLAIYLNDERIDIFDPESNEIFLTGIYKRPYWVIECQTNKESDELPSNKTRKNRVFVNLATIENDKTPRYTTRSVVKNQIGMREMNQTQIVENNQNSETSQNNSKVETVEPPVQTLEVHMNDNSNTETKDVPKENLKVGRFIHEHSNFYTSIWDREFHNPDEMPMIKILEKESPFSKKF